MPEGIKSIGDVKIELKKRDLNINLSGFCFADEGKLPEDFEVYLIVLKDGGLSAGCWDTGSVSCQDGEPGCFLQSRGGSISLEDALAWKAIEDEKIDVAEYLEK